MVASVCAPSYPRARAQGAGGRLGRDRLGVHCIAFSKAEGLEVAEASGEGGDGG